MPGPRNLSLPFGERWLLGSRITKACEHAGIDPRKLVTAYEDLYDRSRTRKMSAEAKRVAELNASLGALVSSVEDADSRGVARRLNYGSQISQLRALEAELARLTSHVQTTAEDLRDAINRRPLPKSPGASRRPRA